MKNYGDREGYVRVIGQEAIGRGGDNTLRDLHNS